MVYNKGNIDALYDKINSTKILKAEALTYKQLNILAEVFEKLKELEEDIQPMVDGEVEYADQLEKETVVKAEIQARLHKKYKGILE